MWPDLTRCDQLPYSSKGRIKSYGQLYQGVGDVNCDHVQGLHPGWSDNTVCVIICYWTCLGNVQIGQSGKAVFVCFLLAWWMDERWTANLPRQVSSIWWHIQGCHSTLDASLAENALTCTIGDSRQKSPLSWAEPGWENFSGIQNCRK